MKTYWVRVIHNDNSISEIKIELKSTRNIVKRMKKYSDTIKNVISYGTTKYEND
jgi:hypothetical protein